MADMSQCIGSPRPPASYSARRRWYKEHRPGVTAPVAEGDGRMHLDEVDPLLPPQAGGAAETVSSYSARRAWFSEQARCRRRFRDFVSIPVAPPHGEEAHDERSPAQKPEAAEADERFRALASLVLVVWFGLATWFSAGAVLPQLVILYAVEPATASLLTLFVNIGFLCGALGSSAVGLPDRYPPQLLIAAGTIAAAGCNGALLLPGCGFVLALLLRFGSGMAMALVYPIACKFAATWFVRGRGGAMGAVLGAVVLGTASPHFVNAMVDAIDWRVLVLICSLASTLGGVLALLLLRPGPHLSAARAAAATTHEPHGGNVFARTLGNRELVCAVLAYCGHNWELYGMWSSYHAFSLQSVQSSAPQPPNANDDSDITTLSLAQASQAASAITFGVIAMGAVSSVTAGWVADRIGRTQICLLASALSGMCSMSVGSLVSSQGPWVMVLGLIWGFAVIADSAQYSAMVSELSDPELVGSSLTLQFAVGFVATMPPMYLVPWLARAGPDAWAWAFRSLAPGALLALGAILRLRSLPRARLVGGGTM